MTAELRARSQWSNEPQKAGNIEQISVTGAVCPPQSTHVCGYTVPVTATMS